MYNLAAFYWRMKGNLNEAVECLRRALHFSPENYKDVALVSLANILHRSVDENLLRNKCSVMTDRVEEPKTDGFSRILVILVTTASLFVS